MQAEPVAYLNGQFLPYSQATLPLHDAGFVYGAMVTDRLRTFRQRFFLLEQHLQRFRRSCELAAVPLRCPPQELESIARGLLDRNRPRLGADGEMALVMFATPGPAGALVGHLDNGPPTIGMYAFPVSFARLRRMFEEGGRLALSERAVPSSCIDPHIKHRSRLPWWLAEREIPPGAAPLLVTPRPEHFVRETPAANFLTVREGTVISPPRQAILNGIGLNVVERLCGNLGIPFTEREMTAAELVASPAECLLTNSSFCIAGVSELAGQPLPWPGPVWHKLLAAWSDLVGLDIARQIRTNP
jgi:branched-chain amino acid aminotransferase